MLAGCFASHEHSPPPCPGSPIECAVLVAPGCCSATSVRSATCSAGVWECPAGSVPAADCIAITPDCPVVDAGPEAPWNACETSAECVIRPSTCCFPCDGATAADVDAVHHERLTSHRLETCPEEVTCESCVRASFPWLVTFCSERTCGVVDVRSADWAGCVRDDECVVRGRECCECARTTAGLIAIRRDRDDAFRELVCDAHACLECPRGYPDYDAVCDADGLCAVRME